MKGVKIAYVNLKVSWDTFKPVHSEKISRHKMHSEYIEVPVSTAEQINAAKAAGKDIWAVGTTVVRTLESATNDKGRSKGKVQPFTGRTNIFIYPGYKFKTVDHMLTNFHAPKTTVLMMVSAFAGLENIKHLYDEALIRKYRFLSYGDSMLLV